MCGIVAAVAAHNVVLSLIEGLIKLEYRGYDSAGLAIGSPAHPPARRRPRGRARQSDHRRPSWRPLAGWRRRQRLLRRWQGWIDDTKLAQLAEPLAKSQHGKYLQNLINDKVFG